jgi:hypothetical protein
MNQFLGDRFQDINDAIVSASNECLLEIEQELSASLAQVRSRLSNENGSKPTRSVITHLPERVEGVSGG